MNLNRLEGETKLSDAEIDFLIKHFCGISGKTNIAYIGSINIDVCLKKQRNGEFQNKEKVIKNLGPLFESRYSTFDGIIFVIHGPSPDVDSFIYNNHWSLGFFDKARNKVYHYDSLENLNEKKFKEVLQFFNGWKIIVNSQTKIYAPSFIPKQPSFWECGYFVLMFAYIILDPGKRKVNPIDKIEVFSFIQQGLFNMNPNSIFRTHISQFISNLLTTQIINVQ